MHRATPITLAMSVLSMAACVYDESSSIDKYVEAGTESSWYEAGELIPDESSEPAHPSIIERDTYEPVAMNYHEDPDSITVEDEEEHFAPLLSGCTDYFRGSDPYHSLEVDGNLATSYVLTGIGGRILGQSDWTTLHLRGQEINPDGTLGSEITWKFGTDPNHPLEAWYEVPAGYLIVGIGMREVADDLQTLIVNYRRYDPAQGKLVGSTYEARAGASSTRTPEVSFGTWDESPDTFVLDHSVITGVGARSGGESVTTLRIRVCQI